MNKYDVIIIGSGPIGMKCGIQAERRNISYLIIEKGCLVNSVYNYPTNMTFFSTSERLEIGTVPFVSHSDKPTRREALEYYRRVKDSWKLKINTYEKVINVSGEKNNFTVETDKGKYNCKKIIVSTGFYDTPNLLNIPGEELQKVKHYFDEAHPYAYLNLTIIGAGNSAVDVALETYRRGANVTIVIKEDKIKDSVKYWVKPDIENRIKEGSIKTYFNSEVSEIREKEIDIITPKGKITIENDFVFAMTGYHPDFDFLKMMGIKISDDDKLVPQFNEDTFETNVKGIYLAGVVCGGMNTGKYFIENSINHAINIFDHIQSAKE
ncbi:MAG: YpdA family putative bacillithiol disulfide reductase [Bacteroidetes bacterium]|nr:YpdA family putative bacillithiol disulfide reductase [Bacteroidota bacterium]